MKPSIRIIRHIETPSETLGVITYGNIPCGVTLELPWRDNEKNVSRIPSGTYKGVTRAGASVQSAGVGRVVEIKGVKGRDGILIHVGNTSVDTNGCILLGDYYGKLLNRNAVLNSGYAYSKFIKLIPPEVTVEIIDCFPPKEEDVPIINNVDEKQEETDGKHSTKRRVPTI